jgi:aminoglycoside/choline kinase family phosphotransferase
VTDSHSLRQHADRTLLGRGLIGPDTLWTGLAGGGGQRRYLRLEDGRGSRILCLSGAPQHFGGPKDENSSFLYLGELLGEEGGRGPALLAHGGPDGSRAAWFLLEDLGERRLLELALATPHEDGLLDLCLDALDLLIELQQRLVPPRWDPARMHSPHWGTGLLLAEESGPWRTLVVRGHLGLDLDHAALERECLDLARVTGRQPGGVFVHRDFQSTNLMLAHGRWRVIDFQGARLGSPLYDLASLVYDPYLALPPDVRLGLIEEYAEAGRGVHGLDEEDLRVSLARVAAHRLMQAQAAYVRIARAKGDTRWLRYLVPAASALRGLCLDGGLEPWPLFRDTCWRVWDRLNRQGVRQA